MKIERQRSRICLRWTEEENDLLRTLYPSYDALLARMPHRSLAALKHRVRVMGIVVRRHVWTNREVRRLFEAYENRATNVELQRLFPALRLCQIESKASHVGAVRRKAPLVTFDIPALDAIRARSVAMGLLLAELDERAGTRLIGRAHVCTPVTNAHPACRPPLEKTNTPLSHSRTHITP